MIFGGEEGITTNRTRLFRHSDINFGAQIQVYYLIADSSACMIAMYALTRTRSAYVNAVRETPNASSSLAAVR